MKNQRAASSDAAQGDGDAMARFETLAEFLLGEGPMQGRQFGEPGPTTDDGKWRRNYWWRDEVRAVRNELRGELRQAADGEAATGGDDEPQARNEHEALTGFAEWWDSPDDGSSPPINAHSGELSARLRTLLQANAHMEAERARLREALRQITIPLNSERVRHIARQALARRREGA